MNFANWYFLLLIPIIIAFIFIQKKESNIKFSSVKSLYKSGIKKTHKHYIEKALFLLAIIFFIIALARPQSSERKKNIQKYGIDILITLDTSASMLGKDYNPNRLEVAKVVIEDFVSKRVNDRIGLVLFSGFAITKIPLTIDYKLFKRIIKSVSVQDIYSYNKTAIGMGLSVAINRLKDSDSKSKIIILATDGQNNAGQIEPTEATEIAKKLDIKIYTIGIGSYKFGNSGFDEPLLKYIAKETKGEYFRATNQNKLIKIFDTIDKLEKTKIDIKNFLNYHELFEIWIIFGLICLLLSIFFKEYFYIKIP